MAQTMYTHMNKWINNLKKENRERCLFLPCLSISY
jgi:hypothetical protein